MQCSASRGLATGLAFEVDLIRMADYGALHKHREVMTERDELVTRQTKLTSLHAKMMKDVEKYRGVKGEVDDPDRESALKALQELQVQIESAEKDSVQLTQKIQQLEMDSGVLLSAAEKDIKELDEDGGRAKRTDDAKDEFGDLLKSMEGKLSFAVTNKPVAARKQRLAAKNSGTARPVGHAVADGKRARANTAGVARQSPRAHDG